MASSSLGKINLGKKDGWEVLYRKFIGILPHERNQTAYGCINGIDIFKYDMPWQAFGLDPKVNSVDDVKSREPRIKDFVNKMLVKENYLTYSHRENSCKELKMCFVTQYFLA